MAFKTLLPFVGLIIVYQAVSLCLGLRRNIAAAKATGFKYAVLPCSPYWIPWLIFAGIAAPLLKELQRFSWTEPWLDIMLPDFFYRTLHESFAKYGDTYCIVTPYSLNLHVASAPAIRQITAAREAFPKELADYKILDQFGVNIITTEGHIWRMHRQATSGTFTEKNSSMVFKESISQAQGMCKMWMAQGDRKGSSKMITKLEDDFMRFTLNIIGYVGFGMNLLWPGETVPPGTDPKLEKYGSLEPAEGYTLSFVDTMAIMLDHLFLLLVLPWWLLRFLPFKMTRLAETSARDFTKYVNVLIDERIEEQKEGKTIGRADLVGQLTQAVYSKRKTINSSQNSMSTSNARAQLTHDDIVGNSFVFLVAGHETSAGALHFTLLYLACNPSAQRKLQKEVDEIFGDSDPSTWDYNKMINPMMASMIGACMNETLRLLPAIVRIPKKVTDDKDQSITLDGNTHILRRGMGVSIATTSVHRNPKYWPTRPSKVDPGRDDIHDFVPERWYLTSEKKSGQQREEDIPEEEEDFGGYRGRDTSASLFRPERGAFVPFSDGGRSCLGRRIAVIEIVAALAVIFRDFSVELATDEFLTEGQREEEMSVAQKKEVYGRAQESCRKVIGMATSKITLKLHGKHVPVRIVKRGEERYVNRLDS